MAVAVSNPSGQQIEVRTKLYPKGWRKLEGREGALFVYSVREEPLDQGVRRRGGQKGRRDKESVVTFYSIAEPAVLLCCCGTSGVSNNRTSG